MLELLWIDVHATMYEQEQVTELQLKVGKHPQPDNPIYALACFLKIARVELVIFSFSMDQLIMRPALDNPALFHNHDTV